MWNDQKIFLCEVCGLGYLDENTADDCEYYCINNRSCSLEISRKALEISRKAIFPAKR
jgi:hypothetical protein